MTNITLTNTYHDASGAPQSGTVTFTPVLANPAVSDTVVILATPVVATVKDGALSVTLLTTDSYGDVGSGVVSYRVVEKIADALKRTFFIIPTSDLGATKSLATLTAYQSAPGQVAGGGSGGGGSSGGGATGAQLDALTGRVSAIETLLGPDASGPTADTVDARFTANEDTFDAHQQAVNPHGTALKDLLGVSIAGIQEGNLLGYQGGQLTPVSPAPQPQQWKACTLGAALTADTAYFAIQARLEPGGVVRIRGRATAATWASGDTLFTLPAGMVPEKKVDFRVMISGNDAPVEVDIVAGAVKALSAQTSPGFLSVEQEITLATSDTGIPVPPTPTPPVAAFTANPTSGYFPLSVDFADVSTNTPTEWLWDFGDGTTSTLQNPQHIYTTAATRTVTLTVTNVWGTSTTTRTITVLDPASRAPIASFSMDVTVGKAPLTVHFTDTSTGTDPATSWSWNFGGAEGTSTLQNPSHTYNTPGTYTVTLTATNAFGSSTASGVVTPVSTTQRFAGDPGPGKFYWGSSNAFGTIFDLEDELKPYHAGTRPPLTATRVYSGTDLAFDAGTDAEIVAAVAGDVAAFVTLNWSSFYGTVQTGANDATLIALAKKLHGYGTSALVYVALHHEPEELTTATQTANYRAGYVYIYTFLANYYAAQGWTKNYAITLCLMAQTWRNVGANWRDYYAGPAYVDFFAADGYMQYTELTVSSGYNGTGNKWTEGRYLYSGVASAAATEGKAWMSWEWGYRTATDVAHIDSQWNNVNVAPRAGRSATQMTKDWMTEFVNWAVANGCVGFSLYHSGGDAANHGQNAWDDGTWAVTKKGSNQYASPNNLVTESSSPRAQQYVDLVADSRVVKPSQTVNVSPPPPAGVDPVVRSWTGAGTAGAGATSKSVTIPGTTKVGDRMYLFASTRNTSPTWTDPAGWTPVGIADPNLTAPPFSTQIACWTKVAVSGDITGSATVVADPSGTQVIAVGLLVIDGTTCNVSQPDVAGTIGTDWLTWGNSTSLTGLQLTTLHDKSLDLIVVAQLKGSATGPVFTTPSGWTAVGTAKGDNGTQCVQIGVFSKSQATAGTTPAVAVGSDTSNTWVSVALPVRAG